MPGFTCAICGQYHDELPLCFGAEVPDFYYSVPPAERAARIEISADWCVVDGAHFFVRGRIEIPILDYPEPLVWNVWTSLSEANFIRAQQLWNDPLRVQEEPYFGWLQTVVPGYENSLNIRVWVHSQPVGIIPRVEVVEAEHSLTRHQHEGVALALVQQVVEQMLHEK